MLEGMTESEGKKKWKRGGDKQGGKDNIRSKPATIPLHVVKDHCHINPSGEQLL